MKDLLYPLFAGLPLFVMTKFKILKRFKLINYITFLLHCVKFTFFVLNVTADRRLTGSYVDVFRGSGTCPGDDSAVLGR